ncbi:MAG: hypothetical protein Q7S64_00450 [bacterium]|nr:hypothetical protein [bacterium]
MAQSASEPVVEPTTDTVCPYPVPLHFAVYVVETNATTFPFGAYGHGDGDDWVYFTAKPQMLLGVGICNQLAVISFHRQDDPLAGRAPYQRQFSNEICQITLADGWCADCMINPIYDETRLAGVPVWGTPKWKQQFDAYMAVTENARCWARRLGIRLRA